jgi:hypothetical protein
LEDFLSDYQPGGTATSQVIDRGEDPLNMGRWSYIKYMEKDISKSHLSQHITPISLQEIKLPGNNKHVSSLPLYVGITYLC